MSKKTEPLADSAFVVLAVLAEGEAHGYSLQKLVQERGFRFWTKLQRSSIYNALSLLEKHELISVHTEGGAGPDRKVYRITQSGRARLARDGIDHIANASQPRSEIDLGIYALPFLPQKRVISALQESVAALRARESFLRERLEWCRERRLRLPALAFERPLVALRAELAWLERVLVDYEKDPSIPTTEWQDYIYKEPPNE